MQHAVAAHDLPANSIIQKDDVRSVSEWAWKIRNDESVYVLGVRTKHRIAKGDPILQSDVTVPPSVADAFVVPQK
jgi:SAF domain